MRYYTIKTETRKILDYCTCDICKSTFNYDYIKDFSYLQTNISLISGKVYPECDTRVKKFVDICQECFEDKLIPWLESQGATIQEQEMG